MSVNVETYNSNTIGILKTYDDKDVKHYRNDKCDTELIVTDILCEIIDNVFKASEETEQNSFHKKSNYFECNASEDGELIDLTRNYKQEFRTILQNLKCHSHKSQKTSNASLEDQIKKVIEEIKSLESSIRITIHEEGKGDIMSKENIISGPIEFKVGNTDLYNDTPHGKKLPDAYLFEDINDEIVLQVIDLQPTDSEFSSLTNIFPSEEELEEIVLTNHQNNEELNNLNQGDQHESNYVDGGNMLPDVLPNAGETAVENPVPNPEPEGKLMHAENGNVNRKKKSFGRRFWNFIRGSSRSNSLQSVEKQRNSTKQ